MSGKIVRICTDATPRMGDVFTVILRAVCIKADKSSGIQCLAQISFLSCSLNSSTQCGAVSNALLLVRLNHHDTTSTSMDGCSTNESFVNIIEEDRIAKWMLILCFAHCGNKDGKEAGFPTLNLFWALIQKIFCQSEAAKCTLEKVIGVSWKSFSDNSWWS
jgi:hypothetical protein